MKLSLCWAFATSLALAHTAAAANATSSSSSASPSSTSRPINDTLHMFISPPGFAPLPSLNEASAAAAKFKMNLSTLPGHFFIGQKKKTELFFFFHINDTKAFRTKFHTGVLPKITSTTTMLQIILAGSSYGSVSKSMISVAFTQTGLTTLGINDNMGDPDFSNGQAAQAIALGDPGFTNWVPQFAKPGIHGVFSITSISQAAVLSELSSIQTALGTSVYEVYRLIGQARPGSQSGHEHFGYLDGISQPAVTGFVGTPFPGQTVISPAPILVGYGGTGAVGPAWAKDGSFMVFRQLKQLVPEFRKFLINNPIVKPPLTAAQGSALLGARMIGRWPSGTPVDLSPLTDNGIGSNPSLNNNFDFNHPTPFNLATNQTFCPFAAHIRKTHPRADVSGTPAEIVRAGITYGPEVTSSEASSNVSNPNLERGLAFVSYQSSIGYGFKFQQTKWANEINFVHSNVGVDPIIGTSQTPFDPAPNGLKDVAGLNPTNFATKITLPDFVISRGGEYFFTPSILALSTVFA